MRCSNYLEIEKALPERIDDWKKIEIHHTYTPENLYEYINGGAELYLSFGFDQVKAYVYQKEGQPDVTIALDIFDMGRSANAFGVFSLGCETCDKSIGQGSQYSSGSLVFWKDRYYISILSFPETRESKSAIMKLGQLLAGSIKKEGELPPPVLVLPHARRVPGTVRYFRHYIWLNSLFYISNENILGIGDDTEAVMAKYLEGESGYYLLIVYYPGETQANMGRTSFLRHYLTGSQSGILKLEDGKWTGCKVFGNKLVVVFNTLQKATLLSAFNLVEKNLYNTRR